MKKNIRKPTEAQAKESDLSGRLSKLQGSEVQASEFKKSIEWLRKTVSKIKELRVLATPENYSLWYDYFSARKPDLIIAIDNHLKENLPFTAEVNSVLYERFFGAGADHQLAEIRSAIRSLIELLHGHLNLLDKGMGDYEQSLKSYEKQLQQDPDIHALNKLVSNLVIETQNNRESNKKAQKNISDLNDEIEEMQQCLERLSEEALEDALTGVANRRAFDRELEKMIKSKSNNKQVEHCLLLLDIDCFKLVNDNHGHLVGDRVLRFVAQMIKKSIKGGDFVARFGGEEFAVVFPNTNCQGGLSVANTIIEAVANQKLTLNKQGLKLGKVTLSGGLSLFQEGETALNLIERTDKRLYKAKANGRNTIVSESDP
jgi:diguanylate cyclase